MTRVAVLLGVAIAVSAVPVPAAAWKGRETVVEGVRHVDNPAEGILPPLTVTAKELWRVGGDADADEELFGVIEALTTDPAGNVYLLDKQLSEVKVFSRDGGYLRTVGREGEGPGEFRAGLGLFFTPEGRLAVLQGAPPKVVLFTAAGEPAGG